eukprot:TRINITY_DN5957_c0_g2_i8.p1 TRINITY_DN5957_c0_g2~~TRINITY_DN5957_c0_g2_i8.p1  ORF type:complete len:1049 (-),score=85.90 TRINITY_DN5957_c0_g2_i8:203-3010(-)
MDQSVLNSMSDKLPMSKPEWVAFFFDMVYGSKPDIRFLELDLDGDGILNRTEVDSEMNEAVFNHMDKDRSYTLDATEWRGDVSHAWQTEERANMSARSSAMGLVEVDCLDDLDKCLQKVSLCLDNKVYKSGLCYQHCPHNRPSHGVTRCSTTCSSDCRPTTEINCACASDKRCHEVAGIKYCGPSVWSEHRHSIAIGTGTIPDLCELGDSHGPPAKRHAHPFRESFHMAFMGDPQMGYKSKKGFSYDREASRIMMRTIRKSCGKNCQGLVIPGDLTNEGTPDQYDDFQRVWCEPNLDDANHRANYPIWPILGNHDYQNYYNQWYFGREATWSALRTQGRVQHMIAWMRAVVAGCGPKTMMSNFKKEVVDHYEKASMAYGFTIGNHRFAMLQNYPTYEGRLNQLGDDIHTQKNAGSGPKGIFGLRASLDWLEKDLEYACGSNMMVSLVFHDYGGNFCHDSVSHPGIAPSTLAFRATECNDFMDKVAGKCVLAVFVGHFHERVGNRDHLSRFVGSKRVPIKNKWNNTIPVLWTSSPEYKQWLRVKYDPMGFTVQEMIGGTEMDSYTVAQAAVTYTQLGAGYARTSSSQWHCWINMKASTRSECESACTNLPETNCYGYTFDTANSQCYIYAGTCTSTSNAFISTGSSSRGPWTSVPASTSGSPAAATTYVQAWQANSYVKYQDAYCSDDEISQRLTGWTSGSRDEAGIACDDTISDCKGFHYHPGSGKYVLVKKVEASSFDHNGPNECYRQEASSWSYQSSTYCSGNWGTDFQGHEDGIGKSECQSKCLAESACLGISHASNDFGAVNRCVLCTSTTQGRHGNWQYASRSSPKAGWYLSSAGQTCTQACAAQSLVCDSVALAATTTQGLVEAAASAAGHTCSVSNRWVYSHTPSVCFDTSCCGGSCVNACTYGGTPTCDGVNGAEFKRICPCQQAGR